jgi:hypothetical protein
VHAVLERAAPDDVDTRLSGARRLAALRRPEEAAELTAALRERYPARPDITVQAGRAAQDLGRYDDARSLYLLSIEQERASGVTPGPARDATPARAALDELQRRRDPAIETGWLPAYKSGDAGVSMYRAQQVPVYIQVPYGFNRHFFVHLDTVRLDAGTLSPDNAYAFNTFGTLPGLAAVSSTVPSPAPGALRQSASGVALGAGYISDAWRFDMGTTPLGFPVHYLVGGVRYRFDAGPAGFSLNLSRRPETSSELSYAGLRDPWTGAVWGGVHRDGLDFHSAVDIRTVSLFADLGAGVLGGRNVKGNAALTLRTGFTVGLFERAQMRVATGLVGSAWHYANNLRFYTYGQGGYYSPQRYFSLGVPIEWAGRRDALRWNLTATVGVSHSYEKDSPYYPEGLPGRTGATPPGGLDGLVFSGSSSRGVGFSYGLAGAVQYRFGPRFVAGARVNIDHSHNYAPSSALVYLRYAFDGRKDDDSLSFRPVSLYSDF